ncbi:hypothetical protein [Flavobacterium macacae]|uniref:Uncharacterized protein n=1 Tax=Flavobacterium macacae TaxID=2488993 RepID=A0A3P3W3F6_9FLAO|nr:hypothetical protein [Flavobacterium macacae]RRJ89274.1 hypothetical protein EG849_13470 [Flavobacterium macacae]
MSTKKIIIGIAAGVVAGAIARLILKKTGHWDSVCDKASDLEDKWRHKGNKKRESESLSNLPKGESKNVKEQYYNSSKLKNAL